MKLVYHRGDADYFLRDYVYLWNLLAKVSEKVHRISVAKDFGPYEEAVRSWRKLMKKGLGSPKDTFGRGGRMLGTTLFLYDDGELAYWWHGRQDVEDVLQKAAEEGDSVFRRFL